MIQKLFICLVLCGLPLAYAAPTISTASPLNSATYNTPFTQTLAATGGTAPYSWSVTAGTLPPGLTLSPGGVLSGTPTIVGMHYMFTIQATDSLSATGSKAFVMDVTPVITYGNPYVNPPTDCSRSNAIYPVADLTLCLTPGEVPLGTFTLPAVGSSYVDHNYGTPITMLSRNDIQGTSIVAYSTPSSLSATGKYVMANVAGVCVILNASTGAVVWSGCPASVTLYTPNWDKVDDDVFYWINHSLGQLNKAHVVAHTTSVITDFTTLGLGITTVDNGGTGDISSDNWLGLYSDSTSHLAILVNVNTTPPHVYTADYRIPRNGGRTPGDILGNGGFVEPSKGVDSVSGKRYLLVEADIWVIFSVTGDPNDGILHYEQLGPERPANAVTEASGNDNNICEVGEGCMSEGHVTTFQDFDGQQYVMMAGQNHALQYPSGGGELRELWYLRLNAGNLMFRSSAYEGGGRVDVAIMESQAVGGDQFLDAHVGCSKIGYCVISVTPVTRTAGDLTNPYPATGRKGQIIVVKGVGREFRTYAYSRSVPWGTAGGAARYWTHAFASISGDASRLVWQSNLGYYDAATDNGPDQEAGPNNIVTALTGIGPITWTKQAAATNSFTSSLPFFTQWHKLTYNPFNHSTMLWSNDSGASLFGNALWSMSITDPASSNGLNVTKLGSSGTTAVSDCPPSGNRWPGDRSINGNSAWDSKRNRLVFFEGTCTLGLPDASDRIDMWEWQAHYPLAPWTPSAPPSALSEAFTRIQAAAYPTTPQINGSLVYDPVDDLYFSFGWGTTSEPPKFYCPTDLNPTPGTLTALQAAAGCTSGEKWIMPAVGTYTCNGVACNAGTLPQAQLIESLFYDSATHKILIVGEESGGGTFSSTVETWKYDVPTKAFTKLNPAQTPPLYWVLGDPGPPMDYNPNDGLYYFVQKESASLTITTPGSNGTFSPTFTVSSGSCGTKPSFTYIVSGGVVTSNTINLGVEPTVDCYSATLTPSFPNGATGSFSWVPPDTWTYNATTNVWTALGIHAGPQNPGTCAFDSAANAHVCWEYRGPFLADLWIGAMTGFTGPTINTLGLPSGTKNAAYSQQLEAVGTPAFFTWTVTAGSLPAGLSLSSAGLLNGTPSAAGSSTFTLQVSNGISLAATLQYTLTIADSTLSVPITLQEALYPGSTAGVARTNEPFCMGVPIPDSAKISSTNFSTLGLTGATSQQFRILGQWPDGFAKWIESCGILASLAAGGTASATLTNTGAGTSAGTLASDNGTNITVTTGAATFTIRKKNFDGITQALVGAMTVASTGSSQGFVLTGPDPTTAYPANVTCGSGSGQSPCTHLFSSIGDGASIAQIEKNGPVEAVIKATFIHEFASTITSITTGTTTVLNVSDASFAATVGAPNILTCGGGGNVACPASGLAISGAQGCPALNGTFLSVTNVTGTAITINLNTTAGCSYSGSTAIAAIASVGGGGARYAYMMGTARLYFRKNRSGVKITASLQNSNILQYCHQQRLDSATCVDFPTQGNSQASPAPSATPASAFKGFQAYELRIKPNITGTLNYSIANHTGTPTTGTLTGTAGAADFAYIYQGKSKVMSPSGDCYTTANGVGCVPPTTDSGYRITTNAGDVLTGTDLQAPQGWADISNASGVGVEVGVYQFAPTYPKSLEFNGGGTDVRIGIWARQNSQPYFAAWPQQTTHDLWLNFHAAAPASLPNEFLKVQHLVIGRASYQSYNSAAVFPYTMIDPATEDTYYQAERTNAITPSPSGSTTITSISAGPPATITLNSGTFAGQLKLHQWINVTGATGCTPASGKSSLNTTLAIWAINGSVLTVQSNINTAGVDVAGCSGGTVTALSQFNASAACCIQDLGISLPLSWPLDMYRYWPWSAGSGANQEENRFSDMTNWITRGMSGRYLLASHWYRYVGDGGFPRSFGFDWRGTRAAPYSFTLNGFGFPSLTSANGSLATRAWIDSDSGEHAHWYHMPDYYFMTGDETIKDAILDGPKDWFLMTADKTWNPSGVYPSGNSGGNGMFNARALGANLAGSASLSTFLGAVGDADATGVLNMGIANYTNQVAPVLCLSGFPSGCTFGTLDTYPQGASGSWTSTGVSRTRGLFLSKTGTTANVWCEANHNFRFFKPFMASILIKGLLRLREAAGPSWADYWNSLDLAYGNARAVLSEMYYDDGTGRWDTMGFRYEQAPDWANQCTAGGESPQPDYGPQATGGSGFYGQVFAVKYLVDGGINDWKPKFDNYLQRNMAATGTSTSDMESILPAHVISILNNPSPLTLRNVTITNLVDNGGGLYTLSWVVPGGATSYRVKWADHKTIVDSLNFNSDTNTFPGSPDPNTNVPWFAANNATGIPAPITPGLTQTMSVQTTAGTGLIASNFSVKAMATGVVSPPTFAITTPSPLPSGDVGTSYSTVIATSGGVGNVTACAISAGALPGWASINHVGTTCVITGTPNAVAVSTFTVQATDSAADVDTQDYTLSVSNCDANPITLPQGTIGIAYSQTLTATMGCVPALTWSIVGGGLPTGLSLSSGGVISGTPSANGAYSFTARVTDSNAATGDLAGMILVGNAIVIQGNVTITGQFSTTPR